MRKWKLGSGGRGLFDFLRGEFNRGANVKQMMVSLNKQRVTDTPYKLPDNQTQLFKGLADKDCFRCKGTGISKWRRQGTVADLCRCVEQKLPAFQAALEQERQRFLAEEAKQQQDPPPSDDTLGLLQGPLHVISSPEVVTDTPRPHFTEEPLHGTLKHRDIFCRPFPSIGTSGYCGRSGDCIAAWCCRTAYAYCHHFYKPRAH
jgi:hypothetical protein